MVLYEYRHLLHIIYYRHIISFTVYIKTDYIYKDIAEYIETRFETRMKDELDRKILTKFVGLRAKTYSCLIDKRNEDKKPKDTIKCHEKIT